MQHVCVYKTIMYVNVSLRALLLMYDVSDCEKDNSVYVCVCVCAYVCACVRQVG